MTNKDNVNEIIYQSCVLSNTIKNNKLHTYVEHSLLLSISERYGNLNLYPYGSRVYDAASMESDFNVFLDFGKRTFYCNFCYFRILFNFLFDFVQVK